MNGKPSILATHIGYTKLDGVDTSLMTQGEIDYYNEIADLVTRYFDTYSAVGVGAKIDSLVALVENGPLEDGDVPSKAGRDTLIDMGLAARIIVKGEDGCTAATYKGRDVYKYLYGKSDTISEAKAFRQTKRAIRSASNQST